MVADESQFQLVTFHLGEELYGVNIMDVKEIVKIQPVRFIPNAPYYVEGIIQNPNIKMISIDGVAPTVENIKNGSYPVVGPLYAVTYKGNENENVEKVLDFLLSEDGQTLIEKTGYSPIK